ncbi:branched-chain amino acid transport system II carrier protein [Fundicoccus culcitae]|uniref:Branched-chain amino acid transport system carrier protein n=1 Tax=Fundicoccus culcitae TaxID=2969821 RepID=A0ABY5P4X4_9LACT|nr:branched-chain amino acid transport system II carrier protein [Fundicoccus culcitae]UUX33599.1 branched-chain amino acid transport system II carrier protein [Fundicoccus culcitae]
MNEKLTIKNRLVVASLIFGLLFGAGNLIFPISLGQVAGGHYTPSMLGFNITAVGLPLLGIVALGLSESESVIDMAKHVSIPYAYFFTIALYLTIGPLFATPRTATVSFEVGIATALPAEYVQIALLIYSSLFFLAVLYFALRPSGLLDWVGIYLNPTFLVLLAVIVVRAFTSGFPLITEDSSQFVSSTEAFSVGFLEGYNTMDVLASLAFGILAIQSIKQFGVRSSGKVAHELVVSGVISLVAMGFVYACLELLGTQSLNFTEVSPNGGVALSIITQHYFGLFGQVILAAVMIVACLKTAIGLVVALAEAFSELMPGFLSKKSWTITATLVSFLVANIGLERIISYSIPVLMLLYPLAITLILLHLVKPLDGKRRVFQSVTAFTFVAGVFDMAKVLPAELSQFLPVESLVGFAERVLPFYAYGFGWVMPAVVGLVVGLVLERVLGE